MTSRMRLETAEAPAAVRALLERQWPALEALGAELRHRTPLSLLTVARGSSDHAAHYMAYLVMARLGRLVTSLPMSLVTLYRSRLVCDGLVALAFSQSGQSPDLVAPIEYIGAHGGRTVAFVNDADSPLAAAAQRVFALQAGPERSVAATKSFIAQMAAGAAFVAAWQADVALHQALLRLPQDLAQADALSDAPAWQAAARQLSGVRQLYVIGRGTGLSVAQEIALKFKEVCGIQAEAFSGAEVQHGPMALIEAGFPVVVLAPRGPAQSGLLEWAAHMRGRGASVLLAANGSAGLGSEASDEARLPLVETADEDLDPIAAAQSFYALIEALARARGLDPDQPPHLSKVTRTR